jgi:lipid II:glycine glycyltransferase (peptidoglycan interpeptide bridge formation enzyme)
MLIRRVSIQEWQRFVEELPRYTFFQLPIWAQAYEKSYPGWKIATKLFTFDDGIQVLVPLMEKTVVFGFKILDSLPEGGYGGLLWNRKPSETQIGQIVKHLVTGRTLLFRLYHDPLDWEALKCLTKHGFQAKEGFTHIVKLDKPEVLWNNLSRQARQNILRAQRHGLEVVEGDLATLELHYYKMYQASSKRWGIKKNRMIPLSFLQNLMQIGGGRTRLFFAEKQGEKISGSIELYGKRECFKVFAAFHYEYRDLRPNDLLDWELLKNAYQRGDVIRNFGSSLELPGVERYKESLGARRLDYRYFIYASPLWKTFQKLEQVYSQR